MTHTPVMVSEVLRYLLRPDSRLIVDGTIGAGGHADAILQANPTVSLIGLDRDPTALALAGERLGRHGERASLVQTVFSDIASTLGGAAAEGVFLDLGVSSMQIDEAGRGFSYGANGPLDMRMGTTGETAREMIARLDERSLANILWTLGEVQPPRRARRIARQIATASSEGRLSTTGDLKACVHAAVGGATSPSLLSQVFQSLRVALNGELDHLARFLDDVLDCLAPGGRLVVISYHSLEDRMVKNFFKEQSAQCICPPGLPVCVCDQEPRLNVLTRRVVKPSAEEVAGNRRARSARLRAAEALEVQPS